MWQSKAGKNRKSIDSTRQSKLPSEEFKSQQITEGYYLAEGIYLDNIYSRDQITVLKKGQMGMKNTESSEQI